MLTHKTFAQNHLCKIFYTRITNLPCLQILLSCLLSSTIRSINPGSACRHWLVIRTVMPTDKERVENLGRDNYGTKGQRNGKSQRLMRGNKWWGTISMPLRQRMWQYYNVQRDSDKLWMQTPCDGSEHSFFRLKYVLQRKRLGGDSTSRDANLQNEDRHVRIRSIWTKWMITITRLVLLSSK